MTAAEVPDHLRELASELPLTLSLPEAAKVLIMHERTVRKMVASGELNAARARIGKGSARLIIPRSEVLRWLATHSAR